MEVSTAFNSEHFLRVDILMCLETGVKIISLSISNAQTLVLKAD